MTRLAILLRTSFLILTLICASQTMARSQKYKVTIKVKEQKLLDVFKSIQQQTNLIVFYSNTILNDQEKVSIQVKDEPLEKVLDKIIAGKALKYEVQAKYIVIAPKEAKKGVKEIKEGMSVEDIAPLPPPTIDVSGRVTDEDGNPLMGASVMIKGTKTGTQTNAEGYFTLKGVEEKVVLEISYVGYEKRELTANGMQALKTLTLKRKNSLLDEIQVEAYRTNTRRLSTSNISTVTAEEIGKQPISNPLLALQGRVTGVDITQANGLANGDVKIRVQGQNSLVDSRSEPLIIVDGVPYPSTLPSDNLFGMNSSSVDGTTRGFSPLSFINPADIESISILKDADATSIYGSRGANGVVLITTKKGKAGRTNINVNVSQGWGKVTRRIKMMNTRQYLDMRYEAIKNDGLSLSTITDVDLAFWDTTRYTDWQKTLIGEAAQYTNVTASVSGGNQQVSYLLSARYNRTTDVFPGDFANRSGSLHFNINTSSANQRFKIQFSGTYNTTENLLPGLDLTQQAVGLVPSAPALFLPDGSLNWEVNSSGASTWANPLQNIVNRNIEANTQSLITSLTLGLNIHPGLQFETRLGYSTIFGTSFQGTKLEYYRPEDRPTSNRAGRYRNTFNNSFNIEPQLTYRKSFGRLALDMLAGGTYQQSSDGNLWAYGTGHSSNLLIRSVGAGTTVTASASENYFKYAALFGRIGVVYDRKYIVNLNIRRDGSSRFGDNNKFNTFASLGASWIFTEEKALAGLLPFLSFGKLTATYGITGGDQIGNDKFRSSYQELAVSLPYQGIASLQVNNLRNPNLQWEEVRKFSIGSDLGFMGDRVVVKANYSVNVSSNQVLTLSMPGFTGRSGILANLPAKIRNTTWEISATAKAIRKKDFEWTTTLNVTLPRNILLEFPGIENSTFSNSNSSGVVVGYPLGVQAVFRYAGIDPATGNGLVYDINGNVTATPSSSTDRTLFRSTRADLSGGWNNSFSYKGFGLSFLFQFVRKLGIRDAYYFLVNPAGRFVANPAGVYVTNQPISVMNDRWKKPGEHNEMVRYTSTGSAVHRAYGSDAYYTHEASYIRLQNLAFSWQFPQSIIKKIGLQSGSVNFQGQNLLTLTKFTGLDPESAMGSGTGIFALPPLQMWTFGMQLGF